MLTAALVLNLLALAALATWTWRLRSRERALRYCWYKMSDFAASLVFKDSEEFDHRWRDLIVEHERLMRRFGATPAREAEVRQFEAILAKAGIPLLAEHRR